MAELVIGHQLKLKAWTSVSMEGIDYNQAHILRDYQEKYKDI